jgi:hypothetical protein
MQTRRKAMKTPDKIYIQTNAGEAFSSKWTTIPFRDFENTEYIRKDALLKWISGVRTIPREYAQIRDLAFQEIVNYLNTM